MERVFPVFQLAVLIMPDKIDHAHIPAESDEDVLDVESHAHTPGAVETVHLEESVVLAVH